MTFLLLLIFHATVWFYAGWTLRGIRMRRRRGEVFHRLADSGREDFTLSEVWGELIEADQ